MPHKTVRKVTDLHGYYATGDYECFCFGKYGPEEYHRHQEQHPAPRAPEVASKVLSPDWEPSPEEAAAFQEYDTAFEAWGREQETLRVYPGNLLPEHGNRKGRWRITVEFWPEDSGCLHPEGEPASETKEVENLRRALQEIHDMAFGPTEDDKACRLRLGVVAGAALGQGTI